MDKLKVLIVAELLDAYEIGESVMTIKLVKELCDLVDVTVLALECIKGPPLAQQLPRAEVVTWREPALFRKHQRLAAMLKTSTLFLSGKVEHWIKQSLASGRTWDIAHQLSPSAPRYYTALRKFDLPYVVGPVGGALETPEAFKGESSSEAWFTKLRFVDQLRFKYDPWLRSGYSKAEMVIGVAPYVREVLRSVPIKSFRSFLGIGVDGVAPARPQTSTAGPVRLLHIGRGVRTKGLRDIVRAMTYLKDKNVALTSIGQGSEIDFCKKLAVELGVADRISFLGQLPHAKIEEQVAASDIFVFPSFRESMGIVLFETMSCGLPVVTVRMGGPDWIVDEECGIKIDVTDPLTMPKDLAAAISRLVDDPQLRAKMGDAAREKLRSEHVWPVKARRMCEYYMEALASSKRLPAAMSSATSEPHSPA
jgi:glycosyltransferase involved in cell wall biosynthesis